VRTELQLNLDPNPGGTQSLSRAGGDVVLYLLKRHSGTGAVRGIAPRRGREEIGEPCGRTRPRPHALAYLGLPN